jgi:XTP/dITP diphosphohydrolase
MDSRDIVEQAALDLLIATGNAGKLREFAQLLRGLPVRLRDLTEFPSVAEVAETGATFAENAVLKARGYYEQTKLWTLADDSGLEVAALGGAPGIFSARYAGTGATDETRRARLLAEISQLDDSARQARFVCVIALVEAATEPPKIFTGICEGLIAHEARGQGGFGYDPIFVPAGYEQTFGELAEEIKGRISHRARAATAVKAYLRARLSLSA